MKLTHLSNQRVIVSRLQPVSGGGAKHALSTVTAALAHLEPLSPEKSMAIEGVPGKSYRIFVDHAEDIQEGDQIKDEDGNIYTVKKGGVTKWQMNAISYKEILLVRT